MVLVAPSLLSADFGRLAEEVDAVVQAGADWIHVDVMDGRFVPNLTLGPPVIGAVKAAAGGRPLDVHLMIEQPERSLDQYRAAGADWITVHAEASVHLHRTLQAIRALGAKAGVALNPATPPEVVDWVLDLTDLVLIMTVNPGFGGQVLIEAALPKVSWVRERVHQRGLSTLVEVDGGVKVDNARKFVDAGAQVLVSGSAVFGAADRGAAIRALRAAGAP
jgi:ribulose-phosphate 3-epimerase